MHLFVYLVSLLGFIWNVCVRSVCLSLCVCVCDRKNETFIDYDRDDDELDGVDDEGFDYLGNLVRRQEIPASGKKLAILL